MKLGVLGATASVILAGCSVGDNVSGPTAAASLTPRAAGSTVMGSATFQTIDSSTVQLTLNVTGASPGDHGVHLHVNPSCEPDDMGVAAGAAGGHWNPTMSMHGHPDGAAHHLGDCGNMTVKSDGSGQLVFSGKWTIGDGATTDIINKAIIVHANPDDGVTQMPPGNAGARQACGLVAMAN